MTYELEEIKKIRKSLGLTQAELAKRADVSQSIIAKIESGSIDPTLSKAKKIFGIYKQLKLFRPKATDQELFRETARIYYSNLRWDEHKIKMTVDAIFEKSTVSKEGKDIKDVASSILIFEILII